MDDSFVSKADEDRLSLGLSESCIDDESSVEEEPDNLFPYDDIVNVSFASETTECPSAPPLENESEIKRRHFEYGLGVHEHFARFCDTFDDVIKAIPELVTNLPTHQEYEKSLKSYIKKKNLNETTNYGDAQNDTYTKNKVDMSKFSLSKVPPGTLVIDCHKIIDFDLLRWYLMQRLFEGDEKSFDCALNKAIRDLTTLRYALMALHSHGNIPDERSEIQPIRLMFLQYLIDLFKLNKEVTVENANSDGLSVTLDKLLVTGYSDLKALFNGIPIGHIDCKIPYGKFQNTSTNLRDQNVIESEGFMQKHCNKTLSTLGIMDDFFVIILTRTKYVKGCHHTISPRYFQADQYVLLNLYFLAYGNIDKENVFVSRPNIVENINSNNKNNNNSKSGYDGKNPDHHNPKPSGGGSGHDQANNSNTGSESSNSSNSGVTGNTLGLSALNILTDNHLTLNKRSIKNSKKLAAHNRHSTIEYASNTAHNEARRAIKFVGDCDDDKENLRSVSVI